MMVMMTARTPSLKASTRPLFIFHTIEAVPVWTQSHRRLISFTSDRYSILAAAAAGQSAQKIDWRARTRFPEVRVSRLVAYSRLLRAGRRAVPPCSEHRSPATVLGASSRRSLADRSGCLRFQIFAVENQNLRLSLCIRVPRSARMPCRCCYRQHCCVWLSLQRACHRHQKRELSPPASRMPTRGRRYPIQV
jgi:hypothetical protein